VRVITGKAKGRRLKSVPNDRTRPITDRAKEAIFSIINYYVTKSRFLDLFAGTGQVGIEALSRGASEVVMVEKAGLAIQTIYDNLEHTELEENARVVQADVFDFLKRDPRPFDFIFVAPPQYQGLWARTLRMIDAHPGWLHDDGWVMVQIDPSEFESLDLENLVLFDQRSYGKVMVCFYALTPEEMED
jgi:16S rRNA (guanine(966)-N(2))-methyltransferase RsmD